MAVEVISWALNDAPVTGTVDAMVLVGLANHAGPDGSAAFPSLSTLARYARCDERSVRRSLRRLQQQGVIRECDPKIVEAYIARADRRPIGYDIVMDGGTLCPPAEVTGGHPVTHGGTLCPQRGDTESPEPSLEPSGEPDQSLLSTDVDAQDDLDAGFEEFWQRWPKRNGKKVGKEDARRKWRKLNMGERRAAWLGAVNYADACDRGLPGVGAQDAWRWLRDRRWVDWQTPAQDQRGNGHAMAYNDPRRSGGII